jgi:HPr kinase/phosphorylase
LEGSRVGFHRKIREPTINRPGLALSGFFSYFAEKRVQVLGAAENTYLKSLSSKLRVKRFRAFVRTKNPVRGDFPRRASRRRTDDGGAG